VIIFIGEKIKMLKTLSMITSNAEQHTLSIIRDSWNFFDRIIIVDGEYKEKNYKEFPKNDKLQIIDRPWNDNYHDAYMAHLNLLNEGDWCLIVDSDEYPGKLLKENLDFVIERSDNGNNYDLVALPVVDHLDGEALWEENEVPQTYKEGMWTKHILIRKGKDPIKLHAFGSHVIPLGKKMTYYPLPYHHYKTTVAFISTELRQWILCPEGQLVSPLDALIFKNAIKRANILSSNDFMDKIKEGKLSPELEILSIKNRDKRRPNGGLHPWAQLYCNYFLFQDNGKNPPDNKYTWEGIKKEIEIWKKRNKTYKNF